MADGVLADGANFEPRVQYGAESLGDGNFTSGLLTLLAFPFLDGDGVLADINNAGTHDLAPASTGVRGKGESRIGKWLCGCGLDIV